MEQGEVLAFLGPNGAGKTTTIRMLSGIISPTRGYGVVAGHRTDSDSEKLHEAVGLLTESPGFYDGLTARRNLGFYARFYLGLARYAQDRPVEAEVDFKASLGLRLLPEGASFSRGDVHLMLGKVYQENLNRPDLALHHFKKVLEIWPDHPQREGLRAVIQYLSQR